MKIKINSEAINFFKVNGFKQSKDIISTSQQPLIYCGDGAYFHINQLKKIVDAFDLVESKGGVERSTEILETWAFMLAVKAKVGRLAEILSEDYDVLKHALDLVEKCNES